MRRPIWMELISSTCNCSAAVKHVAFAIEELLPVGDVLLDQADTLHERSPAGNSRRSGRKMRILVAENTKHHRIGDFGGRYFIVCTCSRLRFGRDHLIAFSEGCHIRLA